MSVAATVPMAGLPNLLFSGDKPGEFAAQKSICQELLGWIGQAEKYVYLENFAITDNDVVNAIKQRLTDKPDLKVILVVPDLAARDQYGWLHRFTWIALSLARCRSFTYLDNNDKRVVVDRSLLGKRVWKFFRQGQWLENITVSWDNGSCLATSIVAFDPEQPLYNLLFRNPENTATGSVYTHGKVALVDDQCALIGSANFNPRRMRFDGEIGAFLLGSPAADFRKQLWSEYWSDLPTPDQWEPRAWAHSRLPQGSRPPLCIVPIPSNAYLHTKKPELKTLQSALAQWWLY